MLICDIRIERTIKRLNAVIVVPKRKRFLWCILYVFAEDISARSKCTTRSVKAVNILAEKPEEHLGPVDYNIVNKT